MENCARSKTTLVKFRSELKALIKQGHQLEELPLEDAELRRSIDAYKWMVEEIPRMKCCLVTTLVVLTR